MASRCVYGIRVRHVSVDGEVTLEPPGDSLEQGEQLGADAFDPFLLRPLLAPVVPYEIDSTGRHDNETSSADKKGHHWEPPISAS